MAGKKPVAPTTVYVVMVTGIGGMASGQIQGVYADYGAALTACSDDPDCLHQCEVNYHIADDATDGNTGGDTIPKTKPQTKATKTDYNGKSSSKTNSKKKSIPDGEPNSLSGQTIATTGTLSTLDRDTFKQTVEKYGGKFTGKFPEASVIVLGAKPGDKRIEEISTNNYNTIDEEQFYDSIGADYAPPAKKAKKE